MMLMIIAYVCDAVVIIMIIIIFRDEFITLLLILLWLFLIIIFILSIVVNTLCELSRVDAPWIRNTLSKTHWLLNRHRIHWWLDSHIIIRFACRVLLRNIIMIIIMIITIALFFFIVVYRALLIQILWIIKVVNSLAVIRFIWLSSSSNIDLIVLIISAILAGVPTVFFVIMWVINT